MAKLTDEQRRALQLLARSPNGCTEALILAHGFELLQSLGLRRHERPVVLRTFE
jgi:hypothetical protein